MANSYWKLIESLENDQPTRLTEEILKNEPDINANDKQGKSLLHLIIEENKYGFEGYEGSVALLKLIIKQRKDIHLNKIEGGTCCRRNTPLLKSIQMNNTEVTKILINAGANVNSQDSLGSTPLLASIKNGNTELAITLINSGADINLTNFSKNSPLHEAVNNRNLQVTTALLNSNANINAQNRRGQTPLMVLSCLRSNSNTREILDLLLNKDADVNILDNNYRSPLTFFARTSQEAVRIILNKKSPLEVRDVNGYFIIFIFFREYVGEDIILRAFQDGCCVKQKDPRGASVLHYAAVNNYKRVAYKLLSDGFDVNCRDNVGNTPLHKVSMSDAEIVCMMLYYEADANLLRNDNTSPLINAIRVGNHNLVDLLFLSYEGLTGDDCHKVVYAILENPLANPLDKPTVVAMLGKFESFIENNKVEFHRYSYKRKPQHDECNETVEQFLDLSMKIKKFNLMEYMSLECLYYYNYLVSRELEDTGENSNKLALFWSSLSLGITCDELDFYKCTSLGKILFSQELLALIWGSFYHQLLDFNYMWLLKSNRFPNFCSLLHCDIESSRDNVILNKMIEFVFVEELRYEYDTKKLFRILSFFSNSYFEKCMNLKRHPYELTNSVKTLAEIGRDKARVFIMKQFKTENFYQVHEIINNLDMPDRVKRFLQLRVPVNCKKCRVMCCNCDINEVAKSLENMYQVAVET